MQKTLTLSVITVALGFAQAGLARDWDDDKTSNQKAVFVMTNSANRNEILSFQRQADGSLKAFSRFDTGGRGSGGTTDPLGSQNSLILSQDRSMLFAVNAGSGDISSFQVNGPKLRLMDVEPSGGSAPVSLAQHGNLLFALNFAGNSSVVGFNIGFGGRLSQIAGSQQYLSAANSGASSVNFSHDGSALLVTEKLTNNIDVFPVKADGTLGARVTTQDAGAGLFDLAVSPSGAVVAVEAGAQTVSSFILNPNGTLTTLSVGVPTMSGGTCWNVFTPDGKYMYTANTSTSTVSGYAVSGIGAISPLPGTVVGNFPAGSVDLDLAVSSDSKFLYTLNSGSGAVGVFAIQTDGTLKLVGVLPAFTAAAGGNGIAAL